jgi:hypothetical protein
VKIARSIWHRHEARRARRVVEESLDHAGAGGIANWPWRPGLSRWLDALIAVEEDGT